MITVYAINIFLIILKLMTYSTFQLIQCFNNLCKNIARTSWKLVCVHRPAVLQISQLFQGRKISDSTGTYFILCIATLKSSRRATYGYVRCMYWYTNISCRSSSTWCSANPSRVRGQWARARTSVCTCRRPSGSRCCSSYCRRSSHSRVRRALRFRPTRAGFWASPNTPACAFSYLS